MIEIFWKSKVTAVQFFVTEVQVFLHSFSFSLHSDMASYTYAAIACSSISGLSKGKVSHILLHPHHTPIPFPSSIFKISHISHELTTRSSLLNGDLLSTWTVCFIFLFWKYDMKIIKVIFTRNKLQRKKFEKCWNTLKSNIPWHCVQSQNIVNAGKKLYRY